jgi:hypothetical protein
MAALGLKDTYIGSQAQVSNTLQGHTLLMNYLLLQDQEGSGYVPVNMPCPLSGGNIG